MLQASYLSGEVRVDPSLSDFIQDYCSSEYFYFLDTQIKEHAERILAFWCDETGYDPSLPAIEHALQKTALLKFDLETKRCVPQLIKEFYTFLSRSGKIPQADTWIAGVSACESEYQTGFREDGSVRGTTHVKKYSDVGRNEPCPCGSGKKFKKCCMGLIN